MEVSIEDNETRHDQAAEALLTISRRVKIQPRRRSELSDVFSSLKTAETGFRAEVKEEAASRNSDRVEKGGDIWRRQSVRPAKAVWETVGLPQTGQASPWSPENAHSTSGGID
jgi:hypothetical protein